MKNLIWGFAVILLLVGCSEDTPSSSTSCTGTVTNERSVSFKLNGVLYDFDQMDGSKTIILSRNASGVTEYEILSESYSTSGPIAQIWLKLQWNGISTGTSNWGNEFIDSGAYGCTIIIDSLEIGKRSMYRSTSGQTAIKVYPHLDSLFGRFCGQVKDSLGNVAEVSDGRFYTAHD